MSAEAVLLPDASRVDASVRRSLQLQLRRQVWSHARTTPIFTLQASSFVTATYLRVLSLAVNIVHSLMSHSDRHTGATEMLVEVTAVVLLGQRNERLIKFWNPDNGCWITDKFAQKWPDNEKTDHGRTTRIRVDFMSLFLRQRVGYSSTVHLEFPLS